MEGEREDRRAKYLTAAMSESVPDQERAMCALAYLAGTDGAGASIAAIADLLDWDNERTRTALIAAAEHGYAEHH